MNLENRDKRPTGFGEDYREGDFEETTAEQPAEIERDDKMHRILSELSELKNNVAATAAPAQAAPYANDAVMAELTRLREENVRTQTAQEISAQVTRMKEDLVRELKAIPSQDTAVLAEIRRLADRVDAIDHRTVREPTAPLREPRESRADYNAVNGFAARSQPQSEDRIAMKTIDDINSKLFHLDHQLSELSVMTLANDITPITKDLQAIKQMLERGGAETFGSELGDADMTDKILDELVRMQTAVEDVKKSIDDMTQAEPFAESEPIVQETLFSAKQRDQLDELRDTLENGMQSLNEQIAELHADIKIYAEEGAFAPEENAGDAEAPHRQSLITEISEKKLDALGAQLDDIKLQLATNLQFVAHAATAEDGARNSDYDKLVLDALAEVRYRLDRLETPGGEAEAAASVAADRIDEVLSAIDALRAHAQPDLAPLVNTVAEIADANVDFTPVIERLDALKASLQPDLVPLLNTVAEMKSEATVDLTPVLDAIRDLPARDDAAVIEALSAVKEALERIAEKTGESASSDTREVIDAVARIETEIHAKTDDHSDVLAAIDALKRDIAAMGAPVDAETSAAGHNAILRAVDALRQDLRAEKASTVAEIAAVVEAVAALRRETDAVVAAEKEAREIAKQREALWEEKMRLMMREELARAFTAYMPVQAAFGAPAVSAPAAVAEREPSAEKSAVRPSNARRAASEPAREIPSKPAPLKKTGAKKAVKPDKIVLSPADAIANQIAQKIAMQQLLEAGTDKVGKGRAKRILSRVQSEQAKEPTFEASEDSIRRNANRLVLGRLLEEAQGKD